METLLYTSDMAALSAALKEKGLHILHQFGSEAAVVDLPEDDPLPPVATTDRPNKLNVETTLLIEVYEESSQPPFSTASIMTEAVKQDRDAPPWGTEDNPGPGRPSMEDFPEDLREGAESDVQPFSTGIPTSLYLTGPVAVGLVLVSRDSGSEFISTSEQKKILKQAYKGLDWLAKSEPKAKITWVYDVRLIVVNTPPPNDSATGWETLEKPWRDAALSQMGYKAGRKGYRKYAEDLRSSQKTWWAYVTFFTKYRVQHFAYAIDEKVVMRCYPEDINGLDVVLAHESAHIFGAADEYKGQCTCGEKHGYLQEPNNNCVGCYSSPNQQPKCLMSHSVRTICKHTRRQLGWDETLYNRPPSGLA